VFLGVRPIRSLEEELLPWLALASDPLPEPVVEVQVAKLVAAIEHHELEVVVRLLQRRHPTPERLRPPAEHLEKLVVDALVQQLIVYVDRQPACSPSAVLERHDVTPAGADELSQRFRGSATLDVEEAQIVDAHEPGLAVTMAVSNDGRLSHRRSWRRRLAGGG